MVDSGSVGKAGGGGGAKWTSDAGGMDVDGDDDFMDAEGAPSHLAEGKEWNGTSGSAKNYK
jgi:hypothetical protein